MQIVIDNLSKHYVSEGRTIKALDRVSLTIPANEIFTLLGPSGCGKTTLLRCIVGLEAPDEGEIVIGGETVWSAERRIFVPPEKRGLGMVFQTYAIWPHMTVMDNVAYPLETRRVDRETIRRKVASTLRFVQLEGYENRPATQLSGGQQQRVALARALVAEPKVILFDEPLSNLDAKLREETRKELKVFLNELKITAVYVTHDRIEALSLSDTIACQQRADLAPGAEVTLCVRPEFIQPALEAEVENVVRGRVDLLSFVGEACEGEIVVGDQRLVAKLQPDLAIGHGDEIRLSIAPAHCFLLAA